MVFAEGSRDVGSRRIWQSSRHEAAPRDVETSCITQPPLAAVATMHVADELPDAAAHAFMAELYPKLIAYHEWLYRERDLKHSGLVTLIHPWECGLDTTPPWMRAMRHMPSPPLWMRVALRLRLTRIARLFRRDTRFAPEAERLSDDDGLRMLVLARRAKRYGFELRRMPPAESVLIEDIAFNAMLIAANRDLTEIARRLDKEIEPALVESMRATERALEELWDEPTGQYYSRDAVTLAPLKMSTVATFLPLWAGTVEPERARLLAGRLADGSGFWPRYPVPSVPTDSKRFDADRYWKGPTWVNMNWAIARGLRRYDENGIADELTTRTLDLVEQQGFAEYFSPLTGRGYGAPDFSWTAALALDLMYDKPTNH
jgi:hypothetical protein